MIRRPSSPIGPGAGERSSRPPERDLSAKKLIISVDANEGAGRDQNPHVPWLAEEIAADVAACCEAGAAMVHFHGRTAAGEMDHGAVAYGETAAAIRDRCEALLVPALVNLPQTSVEERLANISPYLDDPARRPDFIPIETGCASVDLWDPGAAAFGSEERVFVNTVATQRALLDWAREGDVRPWLVSFNVSWTRAIGAHLEAGEVPSPAAIQLVLGGGEFLAAHPATPTGLRAHLDFLPDGHPTEWFVSAYRGDVIAIAEEVIECGGHVVVGVGDFPHAGLGHPDNATLVAAVAELGRRLGREPATPAEARQILGMAGR